MSTYDLAIIGAGPGGYTAAIRAAQLGKSVALIERGGVGGSCLNRGCIPTKAFAASAHILRDCVVAGEFGIDFTSKPTIDFFKVHERKRIIVTQLRKGIDTLLKGNKVEVIRGKASLVSPREIAVGEQTLTADNIIIATGSRWIEIPNLQPDGDRIVTSDHLMSWHDIPPTMVIVGGGYIGCEYASILSLFGVTVTIIEATDSLLPNVDKQISRMLLREFKKAGIDVRLDTRVETLQVAGDHVDLTLTNGDQLTTDKVLVAVGRRAETAELGLEEAGVKLGKKGEVIVDDKLETSAKGVYAIGDVNGLTMLAHAASEQAVACVETLFDRPAIYDGRFVPSCIFSEPEIGYVGMSAEQLKQKGIAFTTGRFAFAALGKALVDGAPEGQVIVYADEKGKLVGVHAIGDGAIGIVAEATVALKQGMTARELAAVIHAHPTTSEALAEAARDVDGWAIHKLRR